MDKNTEQLVNILTSQNGILKDALFWSLGSIVTLIALFLTLNFFANRNFRKEEISRIKSEIELKIKDDIKKQLKEEMERELKEKLSLINTKLANYENQLENEKISRNRLEGELNMLEGDIWFDKKVYTNSYIVYIKAGTLFLNGGSAMGYIPSILKRLENTLDMLSTEDIWNKSELQVFLNKLDSQFETNKKVLQKKMMEK